MFADLLIADTSSVFPKFPQQRPTDEQIRQGDDGARLLAGFMLRHNADRVRSDAKDGRASVLFHFDH
jgi:xanthine permease XanP